MNYLDTAADRISDSSPVLLAGRVARVVGLLIEAEGIAVPVGAVCEVGPERVRAECVGFREDRALLMPLGETRGLRRHDTVIAVPGGATVPAGPELLGRVVNALGDPIDGGPAFHSATRVPVYASPPPAMTRPRIDKVLATGIRALDGFATLGAGQRLGLFSGSGVGKSLLLGMITRNTSADVVVVALVGERGREVRDFLDRDLGPEGRRKAVVVVATGDEPALLRSRAPFVATAIAEFFRDQGKDVLLLMDSITRMANSQREIGISAGEPPATRGYPPSVFSTMPKLLERAGRSASGSITGIYSVLVEGDDINEPVADAARGILDGHIWLSRALAQRGHFPALDVLASISRLMFEVATPEHRAAADRIRALLAAHQGAEDLIAVGAYQKGASPEVDRAIASMDRINGFLRQQLTEQSSLESTVAALREIGGAS
ncbi:MAG: type III secretion system ATPase [Planctomycetota bacterium]|nr:MAG: type III secretion system ATPase [Planctomycetota bacterium]